MLRTRAGDLIGTAGGRGRAQRIIRRGTVESMTGLRRSAIYDAMSKGTFPRPVSLGAKAVGWLEHEIDAWIEGRRAERDGEVG
jgi:prophage regulatory protein